MYQLPADFLSRACELAENPQELAAYLDANGASINTFVGRENPIMLLARQGKKEIILSLVDHFGANPNYAADGAAFAGDRKLVEMLYKKSTNIHFVMRGAIAGGHIDWVKELLAQGASEYDMIESAVYHNRMDILGLFIPHLFSIDPLSKCYILSAAAERNDSSLIKQYPPETLIEKQWLIWGAGRSGNDVLVKETLENIKANKNKEAYLEEYNKVLDYAIDGATRAGRISLARELLALSCEENKAPQELESFYEHYCSAIYGAARAGLSIWADELINELHRLNNNTLESLNWRALEGAAEGGQIKLFWKKIKEIKSVNLNAAVESAVSGRQYRLVFSLLHPFEGSKASPFDAMKAAALRNDVVLMNMLMKEAGMESSNYIKRAIEGAEKCDRLKTDEERITRFLTLIDNKKLRNAMAKIVVEKNPDLQMESLLKKVGKLKTLMKERDLNYHQAHAFLSDPNLFRYLHKFIQPMIQPNFPRELRERILLLENFPFLTVQEMIDINEKTQLALKARKTFPVQKPSIVSRIFSSLWKPQEQAALVQEQAPLESIPKDKPENKKKAPKK